MKILHKINIVFLSFILFVGLFSLLNRDALVFLLIAVFFLGLFQAFTGIILFLAHPRDVSKQLYVGGLLLFGLLCFTEWFWMLPPIPLALYYSYILYMANQSKPV